MSREREEASYATNGPYVDDSVVRSDQEEEAAHPQPPRRCSGLQRGRHSFLGSTDQPRLRRRRGSPAGKGPVEPHVSNEADHDDVDSEGRCSDRNHLPFCATLIPLAEGLNSHGSLIPRALLPDPRGEARDGDDRRGERWNKNQTGAAIADALGRPGGQGDLARALLDGTRKRDSETRSGGPTGQVKKRRIRGKQSMRSLDATLNPPISEEERPAAGATHQSIREDNAAGAIVDRLNSLHLPASAGASRSSSSVSDFLDLRVDRHGQALRGAIGAAGGIAAAVGKRSDGVHARGAEGSGGGPLRYAFHSSTVQCLPAEDHRDGPQPAASGATCVLPWSPSGGRPPDGAAYAG